MTLDTLPPRIVAKIGEPNPVTGCRLWRGGVNSAGYPLVWWDGRMVLVSRLLLWLAKGEPLVGKMLALHSCDTARCVNLEHLSEGSHSRNLHDAWHRKRRTKPSTFTGR